MPMDNNETSTSMNGQECCDYMAWGATVTVLFVLLIVVEIVTITCAIALCQFKPKVKDWLRQTAAGIKFIRTAGTTVGDEDDEGKQSKNKDIEKVESPLQKASTSIEVTIEEKPCGIYAFPSEVIGTERQDIYENVTSPPPTKTAVTDCHFSDYMNPDVDIDSPLVSEPVYTEVNKSLTGKNICDSRPRILTTSSIQGSCVKVEKSNFEEKANEASTDVQRPHANTTSEPLYWEPTGSVADITNTMLRKGYCEIQLSDIHFSKCLGDGEFGEVYRAEWRSPRGPYEVAVKRLREGGESTQLVKEAAIMGQFAHPHVVQMFGISAISTPQAAILMEYLAHGDLRSHLTDLKSQLSSGAVKEQSLPATFIKYCKDIANALSYLHKKGFIHRDLAARNILMPDPQTCKIADFGMTHELEEEYYYKSKGGRIPLKWTAPEAIFYKKYTTKSDVWSYGMVMYEIWSIGCKPFEDYTPEKVIASLNNKLCQPPPPGCPRAIYHIMVQCWHPDSHQRPPCKEHHQTLSSKHSVLLSWDKSDKPSPPGACKLGNPLASGQDLYKDLQGLYKAKPKHA